MQGRVIDACCLPAWFDSNSLDTSRQVGRGHVLRLHSRASATSYLSRKVNSLGGGKGRGSLGCCFGLQKSIFRFPMIYLPVEDPTAALSARARARGTFLCTKQVLVFLSYSFMRFLGVLQVFGVLKGFQKQNKENVAPSGLRGWAPKFWL